MFMVCLVGIASITQSVCTCIVCLLHVQIHCNHGARAVCRRHPLETGVPRQWPKTHDDRVNVER